MNESLFKSLIMFYVIVMGNEVYPLLSKQIKHILEYRTAKHIVGFLSLYTLIAHKEPFDLNMILKSFIGYFWFIMTTKMDAKWTISILILMIICIHEENSLEKKLEALKEDNTIDYDTYKKIELDTNKKIWGMYFIIFSMTILGSVLYSNKQEIQHGGNYNLGTFLTN